MASIVTDLAGLASAGEHGAALSAAVTSAGQQLKARHIGLILGLYNIYTVLVAIGYLAEEQVGWPPHPEQSDFDAAAWDTDGGLSDEPRSIIGFLTCLFDDLVGKEPPIFAPDVSAQSFTGKPFEEIRDPRWQHDEEQRLPKQYFLLSTAFGATPAALVYDTLEGKAGWWDLETSWTGPEAVQKMIWQPAGDLLNAIAKRLLDLDLVPIVSSSYPEIYEAVTLGNPTLPERAHPGHWQINQINKYRAFQQIYRDHGWPGPSYRREDAEAAIEEFGDTCFELEQAIASGDGSYDWKTHRSQAEQYWKFLRDTAGDQAVLNPSFEQCSDPSWVRAQAFHGVDI